MGVFMTPVKSSEQVQNAMPGDSGGGASVGMAVFLLRTREDM